MSCGKSVKLNVYSNEFKGTLGCVSDYRSPNTFYCIINTWIKYKDINNKDNINRVIKTKIKEELLENPIFKNYFSDAIIDIKISQERLNRGIRSFLEIEINFSNIKRLPLLFNKTNQVNIKDHMEVFINSLIEKIQGIDIIDFKLKKVG